MLQIYSQKPPPTTHQIKFPYSQTTCFQALDTMFYALSTKKPVNQGRLDTIPKEWLNQLARLDSIKELCENFYRSLSWLDNGIGGHRDWKETAI